MPRLHVSRRRRLASRSCTAPAHGDAPEGPTANIGRVWCQIVVVEKAVRSLGSFAFSFKKTPVTLLVPCATSHLSLCRTKPLARSPANEVCCACYRIQERYNRKHDVVPVKCHPGQCVLLRGKSKPSGFDTKVCRNK